ncbi:MAG: methylglyoxal synthase [Ruminococcaceae bacterium]|nr:methylglyoxal synthase [Oscillospiraceae bacterium]
MEIAIIAGDRKKELMTQFCIAYCGILANHNLCATGTTCKYITEATGLHIEKLLSGAHGGVQQISSRVSYDEIDLVLFFRDTYTSESMAEKNDLDLLKLCDIHNIPVATNIATAEILVRALDRGDLDWREIVNPRSEYNVKKKKQALKR